MRGMIVALGIVAIVVLPTGPAHAATRDWNAASGDWYDPGNWNPAGAPAASDTLYIAGGTANLTTGPDLTISGGGSIHLSGTGAINRSTTHWTRFGEGSDGEYTQTGGTFTSNSAQFHMGRSSGTFTADISGGTFSYINNGDFIVGANAAVGTLNISGGTFSAGSSNFRVGVDNSGAGQGTVNIGGGNVTLNYLSVAQGNANSQGHANVSAGTVHINRGFRVGLGGAGTYTQYGGTVTAVGNDDHFLGQGTGAAVVTIHDGALIHTTGNTRLGVDTTGTLNIHGGEVKFNWLSMGQGNANSQGHVLMTGGTLDVNQRIRVGTSPGAVGTFTQSGGTVGGTNVRPVWVGEGGSTGTYTLTGGLVTTNELFVAASGASTGTVEQSGGTMTVNGYFHLGRAGGTGTYRLDGGVLNATGLDSYIARDGAGSTGTFLQTDGQFLNSGWLNVGAQSGGTGAYAISGGQLTTTTLAVGREGFGEMTIGQDVGKTTVVTTNRFYLGYYTAAAGSTMDVAGGAFHVNGTATLGREAPVAFTQTGGTVRVTGSMELTTAAAAAATYSLQGGVLDLAGSNVVFGPGTAAFHFTGGRLADVGTFGAALSQNGGTLAPGGSVGATTIQGGYTQAGGTLEIELQDLGVHDFVMVHGDASLEGYLDVRLLGGFTAQLGDYFDVLQTTGDLTLDLAGIVGDPPNPVFGWWDVAGVPNSGNNGFTLRLMAVPEPTTALLGLLGVAGLLGFLRPRRRT